MVALIPREVLFGNPERVSPQLSPDGTQLAWLAPKDGVLNVWVAPASPESGVDWERARVVTEDADRGIRRFGWAHDNRHLLYLQDTGGDENWRLHDVDLPTMARRDLTPFDGVQTQLIAMERKFPTEILIGLNRDNPELHDVYRLDLVTGQLTKEVTNPGFMGWLADAQMIVRAGFAPQPDGGAGIMVRDNADAEWRQLLAVPAEDALTTEPISFSEDGRSMLLVSSADTETARLVRMDLATGAQQDLAGDPMADVSRVHLDPDTREPQIVAVLKERSEYIVLDPAVADDLAAIRALHPGDPEFESADDADTTWLVAFHDDAGPVQYFAYDRTRKQASFLFSHRPVGVPPRPDGAVLVHRERRADHPRLRELPAGHRASRPADRAERARRPVAPRHLGFSPRGAVAGQPGLSLPASQLPGLDRLRQGFRQCGRPRVGRQDAGRPHRHGRLRGRAGLGRPEAGRHLWRILRRLRGFGRRHLHAGGVLLRRGHRWPVQPEDADRQHSAVLGAAARAADPPGRRPGEGY